MRKMILDNSLSNDELKRIDEILTRSGFKIIDISGHEGDTWVITSSAPQTEYSPARER